MPFLKRRTIEKMHTKNNPPMDKKSIIKRNSALLFKNISAAIAKIIRIFLLFIFISLPFSLIIA